MPLIITDLDHFIHHVSQLAAAVPPDFVGTVSFILRMAEQFANLRLQDLTQRPLHFLLQVNRSPALRLGPAGFAAHLVEGPHDNIARHYSAFVFVGFWLPPGLGTLALWTWEVLSFFRYRGHWSQPDIRSGQLGLRHGRLVREYGPTILPGLIAGELAAKDPFYPG